MPVNVIVRRAEKSDVAAIFQLICELATFEKAPEKVINTPENLLRDGWGDTPLFYAWVAESEGHVFGMALCYVRYSTWRGPVLYLEDIVVTESHRGMGMGKALFEECRQFAIQNGFDSMVWQVLDWNTAAIDFYRKYGATFDGEWVNCTLPTGEPLE